MNSDSIPQWLAPFRRVTSKGALLPQIDGLRFLAILLVLFYHFESDTAAWYAPAHTWTQDPTTWLHEWMSAGAFGVPIFFAISGFILLRPFLGDANRGPIRTYYIRRLTRIEPPLILHASAAVVLVAYHLHLPTLRLFWHYLATITYTHQMLFTTPNPVSGVTWSLEIEAQFYLVAPLLAWLIRQFGLRWRSVAILTAISGIVLARMLRLPIPSWSLLNYLHFFLVGIFFADLWNRKWSDKPGTLWLDFAFWGALAALPVLNPYGHTGTAFTVWVFFTPFLASGIIAGGLRGAWTSRLLSKPFIWITGGMCYSIYLWHPFYPLIYNRFAGLGRGLSYPVYFSVHNVIHLGVVWILCALAFLVFEKPFMYKDWPAQVVRWVCHPMEIPMVGEIIQSLVGRTRTQSVSETPKPPEILSGDLGK